MAEIDKLSVHTDEAEYPESSKPDYVNPEKKINGATLRDQQKDEMRRKTEKALGIKIESF